MKARIFAALFLVFAATGARSACLRVTLMYHGGADAIFTHPPKEFCSLQDEFNYRIITSARNSDEIAEAFVHLYSSDRQLEQADYLSLYHYGKLLERSGDKTLATKLQNFIIHHSDDEVLRILATLEVASLNKVKGEISEVIRRVNKRIDEGDIKGDDKAIIIASMAYLTDGREYNKIFASNIYYSNQIENPELKLYYVAKLLGRLSVEEPELFYKGLPYYEEARFTAHSPLLISIQNRVEAIKKIIQKKYGEAVNILKEKLNNQYGVSDLDGYLSLLDTNQIARATEDVNTFANVNLFRTRIGDGVAPVRESAAIYEKMQEGRIEKYLQLSSSLTSTHQISSLSLFGNQLIIGEYLYNESEDPADIGAPLANMDAIMSGALYTRIISNDMYSPALKSLLTEHRRLVQEFAASDGLTLSEIILKTKEIRDSENRINTDFPEHEKTIADNWRVDFEELIPELTLDSAALVYFVSSHDSALYRIVISDTITTKYLTPVYHGIVTRAQRLRTLCTPGSNRAEFDRVAGELYDSLFMDFQGTLPPNLHIIANGPLEDLPFGLLRARGTPTEGRYYLGLKHAISRQFSARTMQLLNERIVEPPRPTILGMAPGFSGEDVRIDSNRYHLTPLVYARKELNMLESFGAKRLYYDGRATRSRYLREAPKHGVIHLATHAYSNPADGLESSVFLMDNQGEPARMIASTIANQDLEAELVVLSACQTGLGGQNILEGNVGLTKAYLAAGARTVVASLYDIDDFATGHLMRGFYRESRSGEPPHLAMHRACLEYVRQYPDAHPSTWGGFAVYGGLVAPSWEVDTTWEFSLPLMIGLTVVLALIAVIFVMTRVRRNRSGR